MSNSKKKLTFVSLIVFTFFVGILFSTNIYAEDYLEYYGHIKKLRVYPNGSDKYGIRIITETSPCSSCTSGFYLPHDGENKAAAYSMLLTAITSGRKVYVQYKASQNIDNSVCRANFIDFFEE